MLFQLFAFCVLIGLTDTSIACRGPSDKSHVDFVWKFNTSSIVAFGTVKEVNETNIMFKVLCSIKGEVTNEPMEFIQPRQVENVNQCHYLTTNKTYVVFLDSMITMDPDRTTIYRLDDKEEIEINEDLPRKFLNETCQEKNHYGNPLTIFYADQTNRCKRLTMTCEEKITESIDKFYENPLTRTGRFLGAIRGTVETTKISGRSGASLNSFSLGVFCIFFLYFSI